MPTLSEDEIRNSIRDGSISAITVDTNVFDRYGCNLNFPVLRRLDQFIGSQISVLISEIVEREVKRHILTSAAETQRALNKALKEQGKRWRIPSAAMTAHAGYRADDNPTALADEQYDEFALAVRAIGIPALGQNDRTGVILNRYFDASPPFERKEAKKNEFPDAFALVSLEAHATRSQTKILCVSADKGWKAFCSESEWLVCMVDIEAALALFNDAGRLTADRAIVQVRAGNNADLVSAFERALEARLDDTDFVVDGWSSVDFDTEPVAASLQSVDWESASAPIVIASYEDDITFTTTLSARVLFEASFSFGTRDSIDRDWVSLGSEYVEKEKDVTFEIVVTIPRNGENYEDVDAEVARRMIDVNFGMVEPFQSENPYHEKY